MNLEYILLAAGLASKCKHSNSNQIREHEQILTAADFNAYQAQRMSLYAAYLYLFGKMFLRSLLKIIVTFEAAHKHVDSSSRQ